MKNKGFTLMELLGVIIILGILALVTFPPVLNQIKKAKQELENSTRILIIEAAKDYYEDHVDDYVKTNGNTYCISVNALVENNYLNKKIKDENFNDIDTTKKVRLTYNNEKVNYDVVEECINSGEYATFDYISTGTNKEQSYRVAQSGTYKLEVWGAQGGSHDNTNRGGYGGYSTGTINLNAGEVLYINVGGAGTDAIYGNEGGYNGGGGRSDIDSSDSYLGSGGGATHIARDSGLLSTLEAKKGEYSETAGTYISNRIIIVAGGGGGSYYYDADYYGYGGDAGGYIGGASYAYRAGETFESTPATQTTGYAFGQGSSGGTYHSGGGGGFYGGLQASNNSGGGSGYIGNPNLSNKAMYCYNCTESANSETRTISTTNVSATATSEYAKKGNGYAKITFLGES